MHECPDLHAGVEEIITGVTRPARATAVLETSTYRKQPHLRLFLERWKYCMNDDTQVFVGFDQVMGR